MGFAWCRYTLLCGKPPFEAEDGTLQATYDNIEKGLWTFEKPPGHKHQIHTPHHPPSAEAQDLIRRLLCHNYKERATLDTIETHPFLSVRLPSRLPISALRVPPSRQGPSDARNGETEPTLLFVCLEPALAEREQHEVPKAQKDTGVEASHIATYNAPVSRWRCCSASAPAPPVPPPVATATGVSASDLVADAPITTASASISTQTGMDTVDEIVHQFQVRRPSSTVMPTTTAKSLIYAHRVRARQCFSLVK